MTAYHRAPAQCRRDAALLIAHMASKKLIDEDTALRAGQVGGLRGGAVITGAGRGRRRGRRGRRAGPAEPDRRLRRGRLGHAVRSYPGPAACDGGDAMASCAALDAIRSVCVADEEARKAFLVGGRRGLVHAAPRVVDRGRSTRPYARSSRRCADEAGRDAAEKEDTVRLLVDAVRKRVGLGAHRDDLLRAPGGPVDAAWSAPGGPSAPRRRRCKRRAPTTSRINNAPRAWWHHGARRAPARPKRLMGIRSSVLRRAGAIVDGTTDHIRMLREARGAPVLAALGPNTDAEKLLQWHDRAFGKEPGRNRARARPGPRRGLSAAR